MSYSTIAQCAYDQAFFTRVTASAGQEGHSNAEAAAALIRWDVATAADIEAAYASAVAGGNPNPGGDESVITDAMILSAVQPALAALPPA